VQRAPTLLERLGAWLNEPVMGFLALAALSAGIAPALFALPPRMLFAVEAAEWTIIALFAVEYAVHFALAEDKRAFVLDPWRLLDAAVILLPIVSLLPVAPDFMRSSPALRVLRLVRALLFGARVRHGLAPTATAAESAGPSGAVRISVLGPGDAAPRGAGWPELERWIAAPGVSWMHAAGLDAARVEAVAKLVGLPRVMLEAALRETSYPRLESTKKWCTFALSLPGEGASRTPVLLMVSRESFLSLSLHAIELQTKPRFERLPWGARCVLHVVRAVLERNESLAGRTEQELRRLEALDVGRNPESFFADVFRLKRSLGLAKGDLWRLRALLAMLADGRRELPGLDEDRDALKELSAQADYLHETIDTTHEGLLTLLDMHLNMASYDVNRFMRLLAVVSSLALIPTIVGGLLGMNILGNPWPVTLSQVAFGTFILMMGVLYAFMAKGWLR